jgi:hypothetical protein
MSLSKQDRIELSGKLAGVADEKKLIDQTLAIVDQAKAKALPKDEPNKKLLEQRTVLVNFYQAELNWIDGNQRTELTEAILIDSVNRVLGNSFFPNKQVPMPSIPDGVWKRFVPFSRTHAIGKNNLEAYPVIIDGEVLLIPQMNAKIADIETKDIANRITGTTYIPPVPPAVVGTYGPDPVIQGLLTDLKALVQKWEDALNNQKNALTSVVDSNATRTSQNSAALTDINNTLIGINTWQAVIDFNTVAPTKLDPTTLNNLKAFITSRSSFTTTRLSQLNSNTYLGSITQDMATGSITAAQGLYGERMLFIDMRINAVSGTLTDIYGLSGAKTAQEQAKQAADIAAQGAALAMKATKAIAPGIDTKYMNFESLSGFSVGDRIYMVADDQEELSGSIEEISGNRAKLTFTVSKKYTTVNNTRIYKIL